MEETTQSTPSKPTTIAILGGTGELGTGLALRWLKAGHNIVIGSRTAEKAVEGVAKLQAVLADRGIESPGLEGLDNLSAAEKGTIAVLTVPFAHQAATLADVAPALQGKILIDVTVPLVPPKVARVQLPEAGSAGQIAQEILGEEVVVVTAFQNVAAHHLQAEGDIPCDVLVCGNKKVAREQVVALVEDAGMRGIHAGMLPNSAAADAITSVLININKQYGVHAGIRITGID
ncbi:MAG: NADPH-dependent F420 reductase [Congregibacter sp.]